MGDGQPLPYLDGASGLVGQKQIQTQLEEFKMENNKMQMVESLVHEIFKGFTVEGQNYYFDGRHTVHFYVKGLNIGIRMLHHNDTITSEGCFQRLWHHNMIARKLRGKYVLLNHEDDETKIVNNIMRVVGMYYNLPPIGKEKSQFKSESGIERDCMEQLQNVLDSVSLVLPEKHTYAFNVGENATIDYLLPDIQIAIRSLSKSDIPYDNKTVSRFRANTGLTLIQVQDFSNYLSVLNQIVHAIAEENRYTATLHNPLNHD